MNVHDGIWRVPCLIVRVVDADTIEVDADLGWGIWKRRLVVRVNGLWAPENSTPEGKAATAWARDVLPAGTRITLHSRWAVSFSRVVGDLYLSDGTDYAELVADSGHGELR